jgi:alpha-L-fucosidase
MNASTLINSLVDMVSKNGNLLLDFGPKADGTIDATEVAHLLEAGIWIKENGEAIFNTTYCTCIDTNLFVVALTFEDFPGAEVGDVRFTQTKDAFYILSLTEPTETFVVNAALPIITGDKITMIGAGNGTELAWNSTDDSIMITVPSTLIAASQYCWVFKIAYA